MTTEAGELVPQLIRLARGRIKPDDYVKTHHAILRRILISWNQVPALQAYVPRLIHYCLDSHKIAPPLVLYTFRYITGQSSIEEFVRRLKIQCAILDQLNSVPWPYGIRARRGPDTQVLAPLIKPGVPIDPGQKISRAFRTTCQGQAFARIELFAGQDTGNRTEGCIPLLTRRVPLPEDLPHGERVEIGIQRVGEAGMRLSLRIPRLGETPGARWRIVDSSGFSALAANGESPPERQGLERGLKLLLHGCMQFLNRSWHLLCEEDGGRLAEWVHQTASALERRDEDGIKNALRLLLDDLSAVRNESVAVALETLLAATEAPQEVISEFEQLATLLLNPPQNAAVALEYAWTMIDDWYGVWQRSIAVTGIEDEKRDFVETLFSLLQSARQILRGAARTGARPSAKLRTQLIPLIAAVGKALANPPGYFTNRETLVVLEGLYDWLTSHAIVAEAPTQSTLRGKASQLGLLLTQAIFAVGKELLQITSAPPELLKKYIASGFVLVDPEADQLKIVREKMIATVADWYEHWRKESAPAQEPRKVRQAEMVIHLLDALESPQAQEEVVENFVEKEPLDTKIFANFRDTFRTSRFTRQVQQEARELVDYHLRIIDQLALQVQQEDLYYAQVFQSLAEASGVGDLSAEAQEPLGVWQALMTEEMRRVVVPLPSSQEPAAEQAVLPPDADELLEEIPEENET